MVEYRRYLSVVVAVILGIILQGALILADCKDTPAKAAVKFSKAFYRLDPGMTGLLCKKYITGDKGNVVENYLQKVSKESGDRGFDLNYMKQILYNIETHTTLKDDSNAEVRIQAKRRGSINPVYELIGRFFLIGQTHRVEATIPMVKEDGRWKVCGSLFPFSEV